MDQKFMLNISRPVTPTTATQMSGALHRLARELNKSGQVEMAIDVCVVAIMIDRQVQGYLKGDK